MRVKDSWLILDEFSECQCMLFNLTNSSVGISEAPLISAKINEGLPLATAVLVELEKLTVALAPHKKH